MLARSPTCEFGERWDCLICLTWTCTVDALQFLYWISVLLVIFTDPPFRKTKHKKHVFKEEFCIFLNIL